MTTKREQFFEGISFMLWRKTLGKCMHFWVSDSKNWKNQMREHKVNRNFTDACGDLRKQQQPGLKRRSRILLKTLHYSSSFSRPNYWAIPACCMSSQHTSNLLLVISGCTMDGLIAVWHQPYTGTLNTLMRQTLQKIPYQYSVSYRTLNKPGRVTIKG